MTVRESIDRFLTELQVGRSPETVRTYGTALACFADYLRQARVDAKTRPLLDLGAHHFLDYPVWLTGERWRSKPKTAAVGTYLAALQSWLRFVAREKLHPGLASEAERIRESYRDARRGITRKLPRTIQSHEMEKLLDVLRRPPRAKEGRLRVAWRRDVALVEALRSTGSRISELLSADVEDLQVAQRALRVVGKGSRERLVFFDQRAWLALKAYLGERKSLKQIIGRKATPIFAQHSRRAGKALRRLSPHGARAALWRYVKKAGLQSRITPHKFRHSFGTEILDKTGDLAATQDLLGHASPATTRIYAKVATGRLRKIHGQVFAP